MSDDWRSMFEPKPPEGGRSQIAPEPPILDDGREVEIDLSIYRPWIVQRGRGRPPLMLDLRRYEPKSGMWVGWQVSYPHLVAMEYTGERMISLDFGARHFVIEGNGLGTLARHLQDGSLIAIHEFAGSVWPTRPAGEIVTAIRRVEATREA